MNGETESPPPRTGSTRLFGKRGVLVVLSILLLGVAVAAALGVRRVEREALLLAETGQSALRLLSRHAEAVKKADPEAIVDTYVDSIADSGPPVWDERLVSERDGVRVWEWTSRPSTTVDEATGARGFLRRTTKRGVVDSAKFKLADVESAAGDSATVRAVLWLRGSGDEEVFESKATFRMQLRRRGDDWAIARQELLDGTTVTGSREGFTECARSAGIDFSARHNPRYDTPEWEPERYGIVRYASAGLSTADYDGDGWYDLFFADGASPRLYRNRGDGTFVDATAEAGLPESLDGVNVGLFADLDNDGDQDLFLGRITGANRLYRNDGDGRFTDVTDGAGLGGLFVAVAAAGDYDGDGLLDLYLGRYLDPRTELPTTVFYTRNGEGNSLLRNVGDLRFTDVTAEAGVREGGLTLGVAWADYDDDGDQDLYVANDFGRNALLRNDGDGTFTDVTAESGTLDFGYGMSAQFGDVDNDGDLDLYVSNVHSGQRWYGQAPSLYRYLLTSIREGTIVDDFPLYREIYQYTGSEWHHYGQRVGEGNSLLLNDGDGSFDDVSWESGANPFGWYWGAAMADFDNDTRLDIYASNGWITGEYADDL